MYRSVSVLGLVLVLSAMVSAEDTYPIKLERPFKKGYKFNVSGQATSSEDQKQTVGGQPQENKKFGSMVFEGAVEVLEVGADGNATKVSCVVHHCEFQGEEGGEAKEALAEGTVLTQELKDGEKVVTSDKGEVTPEVVELLNEFLPCEKEDGGSKIDEMLGTAEPKKVGESWPVNAAKFAASLKEDMGAEIDPSQVSGKVTLVAAEEGNLAVQAEVTIEKVVPGPLQGAKVKKATMKLTANVVLPADASMPISGEEMEMTYEIDATAADPNGGEVVIEGTVRHSKQVEYTPAK